MIDEHKFLGNLIQFDMLKFDTILEIDKTSIDCERLKVTLKDEEG